MKKVYLKDFYIEVEKENRSFDDEDGNIFAHIIGTAFSYQTSKPMTSKVQSFSMDIDAIIGTSEEYVEE